MMVIARYYLADDSLVLELANLEGELQQAARDLAFAEESDGFRRRFPCADQRVGEQIGERFCAHAEELVLQAARQRPVPWERALEAWLRRLEGQTVFWWLGGSAALAVRGLPVQPRDFDIITDDAGAHRLGDLFRAELIEPVVPVEGWVCRWFGRAFLHARFEWVGGVTAEADLPEATDFGLTAAGQLELLPWHGYPLLVPPLALQLAVSERRGLAERAALIRAAQQRQRA